MKHVTIGSLTLSNHRPFTLIAGPCQMESRDHALEMAAALHEMTQQRAIGFIYKSSFDKANRTNLHAKRGIGLKEALPIFAEIKERYGCPVLTDVHQEDQCALAAEVVDILQIPAFLCRQTDLLIAAAKTQKVVNVKKGQFLAPWDMKQVAQKLADSGNESILLTERGVTFGYNRLIVDMRSLAIMSQTGYPVIFDATHAVQEPGGQGNASHGERHFVPVLARAAMASTPIAGIFAETHHDPDHAPSDGPCMMHLKDMPHFIDELQAIDRITKQRFVS
jgi:2-dehydro-3-deoxyphosphooctonate aldolase (KDO 8-P synthase)